MLDPKPLPMYTIPVGKNENVVRKRSHDFDATNIIKIKETRRNDWT